METETRVSRLGIWATVALATVVLCPGIANSQTVTDHAGFAELSAGIFGGEPSSYNGPVVATKAMWRLNGPVLLGVRLDFRDDDVSSGRVQTLGAGFEFQIEEPGMGWFLFAGLGVAGSSLSRWTSERPPDIGGGVSFLATGGFGITDGTFVLEVRSIRGPGYSSAAVSLGARHGWREPRHPFRAMRATGSSFVALNDAYASSPGFRGYSVTYQWRHGSVGLAAPRVSFGIDFLEFNAGTGGHTSTGAVTMLGGFAVPIIDPPGFPLSLLLVPEVGGWFFSEPDPLLFPVGRIGVEVLAETEWGGLVAGLSGVIGNGPGGMVRGIHVRGGVQLSL